MINPISGSNPQSLALSGLNRAQERFNEAAVDVVNGFAAASNSVSDRPAGTSVNGPAAVAAQESGSDGNIAADMVKMKEAEAAFKANIKVLEVTDQMQDDLQGIVKKRLIEA